MKDAPITKDEAVRIAVERSSGIMPEPPPDNLLAVIAQAVTDPRMDVEKMERLFALQERFMAEQRRQAYQQAMARLQGKLPQINKDGRIVVKGTERSRYARLEDIDTVIRPLLAEEGFSFSFDEESTGEKSKRFSAKLSHKEGHSETKFLTVPVDVSDFRTGIQSVGSTTSYARRYLIKMHLNLIERDEDIDGNQLEPISPEAAKDLEALAEEVKADKKRFLAYMGVSHFDAIIQRDLQKATTALEAKRKK